MTPNGDRSPAARDSPISFAWVPRYGGVALVLGLLLLSGFALLGGGVGPAAPSPAAPLPGVTVPSVHSALARTEAGGTLTVASGVSWTIAPTQGNLTYYQAGSIVVEHGGSLTIRNTTLEFVQFVGDNGSLANRFAHVDQFVDDGSVVLINSTVTTFVQQIDPYPSLSLVVDNGSFQMTDGALAFPGAITVEGAAASFELSGSRIEPNPQVKAVLSAGSDPVLGGLINATEYAPALYVEGGAHAALFDSAENGTFHEVINATTISPGPVGDNTTSLGITGGSGTVYTVDLAGPDPTDSGLLALEAALPTVFSGSLTLQYATLTSTTLSTWSIVYGGTPYALPALTLPSSGTSARVNLPDPLLGAINSTGLPAFLEALDSDGVALEITAPASSVTVNGALATFGTWSYNLTAVGSGTVLTAADSSFGINYGATPGLPGTSYVPSNSSKILLTDGADGFLANISVDANLTADYLNQSVVVVGPGSNASLYRWLEVEVQAAQSIPIYAATVQADYLYSGASSDNSTVGWQNDFEASDPAIATYVTSWDSEHGAPDYGETNLSGNASLLVASDLLTSSSMPDGEFDGDYNLGTTVATGSGPITAWETASVTPYPYDLQTSGMNATRPVVASTVVFSTFRTSLSVGTPSVDLSAIHVSNDTIAVDQNVSVLALVNNSGSGTVSSFSATLSFRLAGGTNVTQIVPVQEFGPLAPGASRTVEFNWTVNGSLVGVHDGGILGVFNVTVDWNPGKGSASATYGVTVVPAYLTLSITGIEHTFLQGTTTSVVVHFESPGTGVLNITARGTTGVVYLVVGHSLAAGNGSVLIEIPPSMPLGVYALDASAYFGGRTVWSNTTAAFTVTTSTPPAAVAWYDQSVLGLPLWLLIVVLAIVVGAILGFLLFVRQRAKGKVVECGECGEMIPENATACPKCGAEFEADRVRCSRCGSTIPGGSRVCPECAATLLGKEGEEKADPERQGYADFVERFRAEGKKALGEAYTESAFWDWWKRQSSYVPFSQWKSQQAQGSRVGGTQPRESVQRTDAAPLPNAMPKPAGAPAKATPTPPPAAKPTLAPPAPAAPAVPPASEPVPPEGAGAGITVCSNCQKEIPAGYLVCPFCGAVTQ